MTREAIILAGGLGTRLRSVDPDLPKSLVDIAGRPFLYYLINYLRIQGVNRFIFSLGYKADLIISYLKEHFPTLDYSFIIEDEPLGTGGAINLALVHAKNSDVLVCNGDSLFKVNLNELWKFHEHKQSLCTVALKYMTHFDRYGVVETDANSKILSFKEKQYYKEGFINGGTYLLNKDFFTSLNWSSRFSFEKDFLEQYTGSGNFYGFKSEGYFIDIGIPEDYYKANEDFKAGSLDLSKIDSSWTLFLDRDGVINEEKLENYILNWSEFIFTKGALEAFKRISDRFNKIIVISNQRGVGRKLMSQEDLDSIHSEMVDEVSCAGGKIDHIYACTDIDNLHPNRKPNPGMAFQAVNDFPGIDLKKSIMVGNKLSDMKFGRAAGMYTVYIRSTNPEQEYPHPDIDLVFNSFYDFSLAL